MSWSVLLSSCSTLARNSSAATPPTTVGMPLTTARPCSVRATVRSGSLTHSYDTGLRVPVQCHLWVTCLGMEKNSTEVRALSSASTPPVTRIPSSSSSLVATQA